MVDYNTSWINLINYNKINNIKIENKIINKNKKEIKVVKENIIDIDEYISNLNKKNIYNLNSLDLLELELDISINLNKYYFIYNNNNITIIIKFLNNILKICQILKKKLNMKTIDIKKDIINLNNLPRSSYKFCKHKDACNYNYEKNRNKKCHNHHYVHNLLEYDLMTIIYYMKI